MKTPWDTKTYKTNFSFVPTYGADLINMISSDKKDVLDLGCGNGALTKELKDKGFNVIGLDVSPEFLSQARENNPEIEFIYADATNFSLDKPVDVVFSNAMLHWVDKRDHQSMLTSIYHSLKTGGEFIFECGGFGCTETIHTELNNVFEQFGYSYHMPFYFPTIGEYASLLEEVGFQVVYAILFDRETDLIGEDGMKDWINIFVRDPFEPVKEEDKEKIKDQVIENLRDKLYKEDHWVADYVRLRMKAIKPNDLP